MKIVDISREELSDFTLLSLPITIFNAEAQILKFNYGGKDKILKRFSNIDEIGFANKLYTLEALYLNKGYMPNNFVVSDFLVSVNMQVEGPAMDYVNGINLSFILNDFSIDCEEKKYYLKRIGQTLEQMKKIRTCTSLKDFYLGDLHEDNFIVDPTHKEIFVIDLDSCKIANNKSPIAKYLTPASLLSTTCGKYETEFENSFFSCYKVDGNTDLYCYIIVILNYLYRGKINNVSTEEFYSFLNYLKDIGVNLNLLECFERILKCDNNLNPVDYIDSLTREQIAKARIYTRIKNGFKF